MLWCCDFSAQRRSGLCKPCAWFWKPTGTLPAPGWYVFSSLACLVCLVCTVYGCIRHTHVCTVKQGCLNGYECRQGQSDKVTKWYKFIGSSCRLTLEARHCHSCTSGEFNRRKRDLAPRTQPLRHRVRPMCPIQGERRRLFRQKGAQVQLTPFSRKTCRRAFPRSRVSI